MLINDHDTGESYYKAVRYNTISHIAQQRPMLFEDLGAISKYLRYV